MKRWLFPVGITVLLLQLTSGKKTAEKFVNPQIKIQWSRIHESGEGYPYPVKVFPEPFPKAATLKDYFKFCEQLKINFEESNLAIAEADSFYKSWKKILKSEMNPLACLIRWTNPRNRSLTLYRVFFNIFIKPLKHFRQNV